MKITILGQEVEVTKDNMYDLMDELNVAYNELYKFSNNYCQCSRCDAVYDAQDMKSQCTEDGRLCPDCHGDYTITYYPEGGVGVVENKTGRELEGHEIRWL